MWIPEVDMHQKDALLESWQKEIPITQKVLTAFPENKADFKPHKKSKTAIELAWMFVIGQQGTQKLLDGTFSPVPNFPPHPNSWRDLVVAFEAESLLNLDKLKRASDADLEPVIKIVDPYAGKFTWKEVPRSYFLWFLLDDHIHHRGQLSVYLRLVGGKVPSIYGPSADDPWAPPNK
jgi:uncharacterized damage-inducible protein DinB